MSKNPKLRNMIESALPLDNHESVDYDGPTPFSSLSPRSNPQYDRELEIVIHRPPIQPRPNYPLAGS